MTKIADQPEPIPNRNPAVWDLVRWDLEADMKEWAKEPLFFDSVIKDRVLNDMRERDAIGYERYGTRLQPHNGRNPVVDAYQEALDLCVYLRAAIYEGWEVEAEYVAAMGLVIKLRGRLG